MIFYMVSYLYLYKLFYMVSKLELEIFFGLWFWREDLNYFLQNF